MKVAITGHTKGLGKELYNRFDDVKGFSSSNDYDISDTHGRAKIIFELDNFDLFRLPRLRIFCIFSPKTFNMISLLFTSILWMIFL